MNYLQRLEFRLVDALPLRDIDVLNDAPMIHDLCLGCKPILDEETCEKIASGQLGRLLTVLRLYDCDGNAKEWLDMVEARQKNVCAMLQNVMN